MDNDSRDTFFYLSRATIIIPLFIIIFAAFFLMNKSPTPALPVENNTEHPTPASFNLSKIDLNGPLTCSYSSPDFNLEGFIENQKIAVQIIEEKQITFYRLNNDCLYAWKKDAITGQKKCGLSPFLATFDLIKNMSVPIPIDATIADNILNSCVKKERINSEEFIVPKNIQFKEEPLQIPEVMK